MTQARDDELTGKTEEALEAESTPEQDTEAILSRRAFLIQGALAGAGVAAAGCGDKNQHGRPQPCLKVLSRSQDAGVQPRERPQPGPDAGPKPCLKVKPPAPRPCLSVPAPRPCLKVKPPARPCLSLRKPPNKK